MRILLAAGGTGGHVTPALAVADAIHRLMPSAATLFVADGRPVAEKFFAATNHGRELLFPDYEHAPPKHHVGAWLAAYGRARSLLRDFEPDVVVGFGGYPTAIAGAASLGAPPAALLAWLQNRAAPAANFPSHAPARAPLVLLEQNARPGLAVRMLAGVATRILLAIEEAGRHLGRAAHTVTIGNPLPRAYEDAARATCDVAALRTGFGLDPHRTTLLAFGGSQGALGLNRTLLAARVELAARHPDLQILFITGDRDHAAVKEAIARDPAPFTIALPFERRMLSAYRAADVVLARGGGTTLAEVAIAARPLVIVPYPHHKDGHQRHNAEVFVREGAARIVEEGPGAPAALLAALSAVLGDPAARAAAAAAAARLGRPRAALDAATHVLEAGGAEATWLDAAARRAEKDAV
jgi:UDP-N-acetylglucosamine--N-acetylmuramyl-(pentapeptide) pyrophosphoryl-undecaprenol N-acetylglucosamine transferase